MDSWDEIRTAYRVAQIGTVSGAAEALGVHHATVIRHVDALEARLGAKLFQRHPRGYTPTEAGAALLSVAQDAEDRFTQLAHRIRGLGDAVVGELVVTSLAGLEPLLAPVLADFQRLHAGLSVRYLTDVRLLRLEVGEAHVAIRAGAVPQDPDNVVQPFFHEAFALYASESYVAAHPAPMTGDDPGAHHFVASTEDSRAPYDLWLRERVPAAQVVFRTAAPAGALAAIRAGAGIGFLPVWAAHKVPGLVEILPPRAEWAGPLWLVSHVDLHRTPKVQAVLAHLKAQIALWPAHIRWG